MHIHVYLWSWSKDRARDGEAPLDVTEVLSHDGETATLGVARRGHNTLHEEGGEEETITARSALYRNLKYFRAKLVSLRVRAVVYLHMLAKRFLGTPKKRSCLQP